MGILRQSAKRRSNMLSESPCTIFITPIFVYNRRAIQILERK